MKSIRALLILVVVIAMLGMPHSTSAMAYTYTSGFQVQNLSSQSATITLTYYAVQTASNAGGAEVTTATDTIDGLASKTYLPIHAPAGFKGSVVVSSSQAMASIVNLVATGAGYASYVGSSQGATKVNLPLLMKNNSGYGTWYSVQNAGSSNATVNITYSDNTTAGPIIIKPGASYVFDQSVETHSKATFAGTLTSDQPVVVVVVQEGTKYKTIMAAGGFDTGEDNAFMPLISANNSGYQTGIQLQNIGTNSTDITVTYTPVPGFGTACWEKRTIAPGASETFALFSFAGIATADVSNCTKTQFVGGAQITTNSANQPVVAVVNQATSQVASAYSSFIPSRVTGKLVLPIIMDRNSGWYTGFTLANVGKDAVHVTCTFTNTAYKVEADLASGAVLLDIQNGKIADKYVGAGTCTATGSGETKIVAVVNEAARVAGDFLMTYEGINVAP